MEIIPAIDLSEGAVVRLRRGEFMQKTVYSDDPVKVATGFEKSGAQRLHVVDLDGAKTGAPAHLDTIRRIAAAVRIPIEIGGGIRTLRTAKLYAGIPTVDRVILGTAAFEKPAVLKRILAALGPAKVVLSVDVKEGKVATRGWLAETEGDPAAFGRGAYEVGIRLAVFTDVRKDGMMTGPNVRAASDFAAASGLNVIVSGGVSGIEDVRRVVSEKNSKFVGLIIGRALYEGAVDLAEAVRVAEGAR